jgi:hypothetical protein
LPYPDHIPAFTNVIPSFLPADQSTYVSRRGSTGPREQMQKDKSRLGRARIREVNRREEEKTSNA